MTKIEFDGQNEQPAGGFTVYPAGTYVMEMLDWERKVSSKGNPQIMVKLAIKENEEYNGKPYTEWISLTEAALWRVKAFLWALGAQIPKVALDTNGELFTRMLNECKGHELGMEVEKIVRDGKENNNITNFLRVEEPWDLDIDQLQGDIPDFLKQD